MLFRHSSVLFAECDGGALVAPANCLLDRCSNVAPPAAGHHHVPDLTDAAGAGQPVQRAALLPAEGGGAPTEPA